MKEEEKEETKTTQSAVSKYEYRRGQTAERATGRRVGPLSMRGRGTVTCKDLAGSGEHGVGSLSEMKVRDVI